MPLHPLWGWLGDSAGDSAEEEASMRPLCPPKGREGKSLLFVHLGLSGLGPGRPQGCDQSPRTGALQTTPDRDLHAEKIKNSYNRIIKRQLRG